MKSSAKKRRIESSDESSDGNGVSAPKASGDEVTHIKSEVMSGRSSSRIQERKSKTYVKPTRDSIWNKIPSSSEKRLANISPNKRVNDMLRVHNRYNAESIDIFNDDFIDDELDTTTSSDSGLEEEQRSAKKKRKNKGSKIQNRRRRLKYESSSSEDESKINREASEPTDGNEDSSLSSSRTKHTENSKGDNETISNTGKPLAIDECEIDDVIPCDQDSNSDEEDSQIYKRLNSSKNKNVLKSDEESDVNDESNENKSRNKKNDSDANKKAACDNKNDSSDESSDSDSEEDSNHLSRYERQLSKKENLFRSFKEAQAKSKKKNASPKKK
ncbi:clumping factor A [Patella vulgata]|uniref:clumping factor A n=1 Tax=Patella vulgata TaxID=6465 RepID=UPI0021807E0B|nr:clumping factor A [Patella vulgata]